MSFFNLLGEQLADPFRIALIIGLLITANNTAPQIGRSIPLVLGVIFVAVLIPTAFGTGEHGLAPSVAVGIVANFLLFAVCWLIFSLIKRVTSK
ncbi:MAG: hypothetical protein QM744_12745 [Mesorhizobium sp.]